MKCDLIPLGASSHRPVFPSGPDPEPAAAYVHIPFCVRKCHYCDFITGPAPEETRARYIDLLCREVEQSSSGLAGRSLFFGGGTPTEISVEQIRRIVEALRRSFSWPDEAEWTIESNPATVTPQALTQIRAAGFNRISIGVQSFHDHHLQALGRIHSAAEARTAAGLARRAGFENLNLDLIFCLPSQTWEEWRSDLDEALLLAPDHLSLYNLTIEPETEFGRRFAAGQMKLPDEDLSADMHEWARDRLARAGYEQYEISNFALPGRECRHNQTYWWGEPYIGFGLSASSYLNGVRFTTTRSMRRYLETAGRAEGPERSIVEALPPGRAARELAMLGIRTREGADLNLIARRTGYFLGAEIDRLAREWSREGLAEWNGALLKLTQRGMMLAGAIGRELIE